MSAPIKSEASFLPVPGEKVNRLDSAASRTGRMQFDESVRSRTPEKAPSAPKRSKGRAAEKR